MLLLGQQVVIPASVRHMGLVIGTIGLLGAFTIYAIVLVVFLRRGLHGRAAVMGCGMVAMAGVWFTAYSAQSRLDWGLLAGLGTELVAYLGFAVVAILAWGRRVRRASSRAADTV